MSLNDVSSSQTPYTRLPAGPLSDGSGYYQRWPGTNRHVHVLAVRYDPRMARVQFHPYA